MAFDASGITLGNAITIAMVVFSAGGTYAAVRAGLASTNDKIADLKIDHAQGLKESEKRFDHIERSIEDIKSTYVPEKMDQLKDKMVEMRLLAIEKICDGLSLRHPPK